MTTAAQKKISHQELVDLVTYESETGLMRWKKRISRKGKVCVVIGSRKAGRNRLQAKIHGTVYSLHRLVWFYVHGEWPSEEIDHINGNAADNRIENLRVVSRRVNQENLRIAKRNSSTRLLGVSPARGGKFRAAIRAKGVFHHLGHFDTAEEAHNAYLEAKRRLHEGCTL